MPFLEKLIRVARKVLILFVAVLAIVFVVQNVFSPLIEQGWSWGAAGKALLNLVIFLAGSVVCLVCYFITLWIFTGRDRDRGGKIPASREYAISAIYLLAYGVALIYFFSRIQP